jgi:hypothetical protein
MNHFLYSDFKRQTLNFLTKILGQFFFEKPFIKNNVMNSESIKRFRPIEQQNYM